MEKENKNIWIFILVVAFGMLWYKYENLKEENIYLMDEVENYNRALNEANDNIEEANSTIEDAQSYAGESYDDMESALYNLQRVDTVNRP